MADDTVSATTVINASAEAIFAVLTDPAKHAAIDGTGWVCEALDSRLLTGAGQIFRMAMYHPGHPDGNYQMANRVQVFDPPSTISWQPGNEGSRSLPSISPTRSPTSTNWPATPERPAASGTEQCARSSG